MRIDKETPSYYDVLGVGEKATREEIEAGYKKARRTAHPDKAGNEWAFRLVTLAYETLKDPQKREEYDAQLHGQDTPAPPTVPTEHKEHPPTEQPRVKYEVPPPPPPASPVASTQGVLPVNPTPLAEYSITPSVKKLIVQGVAGVALATIVSLVVTQSVGGLFALAPLLAIPIILVPHNQGSWRVFVLLCTVLVAGVGAYWGSENLPATLGVGVMSAFAAWRFSGLPVAMSTRKVLGKEFLETDSPLVFGEPQSATIQQGGVNSAILRSLVACAQAQPGLMVFCLDNGKPTFAHMRFALVHGRRALFLHVAYEALAEGSYDTSTPGGLFFDAGDAGAIMVPSQLREAKSTLKELRRLIEEEFGRGYELSLAVVVPGAQGEPFFGNTPVSSPSALPALVSHWLKEKEVTPVIDRHLVAVTLGGLFKK